MAVDLGKIGIWHLATGWNPELAAAVEKLGFGAIWVGGSPSGDLRIAEELLDATSAIAVATGIVNMWRDDARTIGASYHRIAAKHRGRFLLGVGVGHPERTQVYQKPYDKIVDYLDELDEAGVPAEDRALAALGPKVLRLAGERTAGVHPYLTTPEHTRRAREILGDGPLLAPEQKVVLGTDPERARQVGRQSVRHYLGLVNYRTNLLRTGYSDDDIADGGSDRLIDDLALHGEVGTVAERVTAHLDAGADHICVQVLGDDPYSGYRALADALL